jgi:hypothetical protein
VGFALLNPPCDSHEYRQRGDDIAALFSFAGIPTEREFNLTLPSPN